MENNLFYQKSILLSFILLVLSCSPQHIPQSEAFISNKKLDYIFNSGSCNFDQPMDKSVLWETDNGIKFLLKKLKSENNRDQTLAISYLAASKQPGFIKTIAPYINNHTPSIALNAVQALRSIGTDKSIALLEEKLLSVDKRDTGLINNILNGLHVFSNESSLNCLDTFINQCDTTKVQEVKNSIKTKKIRKNIADYNHSIYDQKRLIETGLFSDDKDEFYWARAKIYQTRDTNYLPLLRKIKIHLDSMNLKNRNRSVVILMEYLGETDFIEKDLLILKDLKESKEKRKANTMVLLRAPLTDRKTEDF